MVDKVGKDDVLAKRLDSHPVDIAINAVGRQMI